MDYDLAFRFFLSVCIFMALVLMLVSFASGQAVRSIGRSLPWFILQAGLLSDAEHWLKYTAIVAIWFLFFECLWSVLDFLPFGGGSR